MNVKSIIKEKGFTIEAVAAKIGVSRVTLSQTLSGNPTVGTLQRIAEAIGCNVGDFFADEVQQGITHVCPHCGKPIDVEIKPHV